MVLRMSRVEWMNGICLIWSRGRLISPSLPIGDDRYLNLSSEKRPTGRNLGGNRLVRRSGTTSRGTVVLVFYLRMRRFPLTLVLTIFVRMKWIGRFRIILGLFFKVSPGAHFFIWKLVFICMWIKTNFHMKGWAPGLALKKRPRVIRKWPIA